MSNEKKFEVAVKRLAVRLNCANKDSIIIELNQNTACHEAYLVMRNDSNKVISYNGTSVSWRKAHKQEKRSDIGWRDFGTLDEFARALA